MMGSNRKNRTVGWILMAILGLWPFTSCNNDNNGGDGGSGATQSTAMLSGTVRDTSGTPLAGVGIHVIYEIEEMATIDSVQLTSFEAEPGDRQVTLLWTTASETDNDHFDITRDNILIARVQGAGNSTISHSYTHVDMNLQNGQMYYYTLISVDINGTHCQLATDSATPHGGGVVTEYALYQNYPNPVQDTTYIYFDVVEAIHVLLSIIGLDTIVNQQMEAGRHQATYVMTGMANGVYVYEMHAGDFTASRTLLKNTRNYDSLYTTESGALTNSSGEYSFEVDVGDSVELRDESNRDLGSVLLGRVTLVALKAGYQPADTTLNLTEQEHYTIDFTLWPE